jgi:hypothetical protein
MANISNTFLKELKQMNKTPHKHAALIKAWADGAEIQFRRGDSWYDIQPAGIPPIWSLSTEYRIKPEEKPKKLLRIALLRVSLPGKGAYTIACPCHGKKHEADIYNSSEFVRWLTDTIEYEAE